MKVLILDAYNLIHRARTGFKGGEHDLIYNFFRGLRPIVEKFSPRKVYFVLEGYPRDNKEVLPEYKAGRPKAPDGFREQRDKIVNIVKTFFPFETMMHLDFECDDVIYGLIRERHLDDQVTIVSTDSDFIQLYTDCPNVSLWHPIRKEVVPDPGYDYVLWKSLRGDKTDNVPGIPGIGDKMAVRLVNDPSLLEQRMTDPCFSFHQQRNYSVIKLSDPFQTGDPARWVTSKVDHPDWDGLRTVFNEMRFASVTNESTWTKFVKTFENLENSL